MKRKPKRKSKKNKVIYAICMLVSIIFSISVLHYTYVGQYEYKEITYPEFVQMIEDGEVDEIKLDLRAAKFKFENTEGNKYKTSNHKTNEFKLFLLEKGITVEETSSVASRVSVFSPFIYVAVMASLLIYLQKGNFFTKMDNKVQHPTERLDDIAGNEQAKKDLQDKIDFIVNPDKYTAAGAKTTKGALLVGPPGTGKTKLVKAIAGETDLPLYSFSGSDFVQLYVGLGASRIRNVFKEAKENAPAIIFIDEIDMIGAKRTMRGESSHDEKEQTLTALLTCINDAEGVYVIGATNRPEILDPALVRAGRLHDRIVMNNPTKEDREKIINQYLKNKKLDESVDFAYLVKVTTGWPGAGIESLLNEAALLCGRDGRTVITNQDIREALTKTLTHGYTKETKESDEIREITAWHEAGHALCTKLLTNQSITEVSILPTTSGVGGYTMSIPDKEYFHTKEDMYNEVKILYAGRAAEEIRAEKPELVTTGASNDIERATDIIQACIASYGMGNRGLLNLNAFVGTEDKILEEATELANVLYEETKKLLQANFEHLKAISESLLEHEVINEDKITELMKNMNSETELSTAS